MAANRLSKKRSQTLRFIFSGAALITLAEIELSFSRAVAKANMRIAGRSQLIATRIGALEYTVMGQGTPLLMIHGTGGGFDQALTFSEAIKERGYAIIAPSRFGYLRSDYPKQPSSKNQADALVDLLDKLGIQKIAIAGGSAGALTATQFALQYPERVSALILLVPAANVQGRDPVNISPAQNFLIRRVLRSDFLFWALLKTVPKQLIANLLATDPDLLDKVPLQERQRAYQILHELMPISQRWRGILNDAKLAGSPARMDFSRIRAPMLIISVEDDRFGTAQTAKDIAAAVPSAQLKIFPTGGHIWLGHNDEVAETVAQFLSRLGTT